jgi:hypothetical protein
MSYISECIYNKKEHLSGNQRISVLQTICVQVGKVYNCIRNATAPLIQSRQKTYCYTFCVHIFLWPSSITERVQVFKVFGFSGGNHTESNFPFYFFTRGCNV